MVAIGFFSTASYGQVAFVDVAAELGIDYRQAIPTPGYLGVEALTGGAAVGDYDADGWEDLLVTRRQASAILYRNVDGSSFVDVSSEAGITTSSDTNGCTFADINNDGHLDLLINTIGAERFYVFINRGDGTFSEEGRVRVPGLNDDGVLNGFGIAVGDYNGDGWIDFFHSEWNIDDATGDSGHHERLFQNRGTKQPGFFDDVTDDTGVNHFTESGLPPHSFSPAFVDIDRDGHLDLVIASDFSTSRIYWNNADGSFLNGTQSAGVGSDENGMGSSFGDFDGDGDLDWIVTSIFDPEDLCADIGCNWGATGNRLYRYDGGRVFTDVTTDLGVRNGWWGWGVCFLDAENIGRLDIVQTNGFDLTTTSNQDFPFSTFVDDPMLFWSNRYPDAFVERATDVGMTDARSGKGLLTFDFDRDGDLDVFIVNSVDTPILYSNNTANKGDWLRIRFRAETRAFEGLNAWIEVVAIDGGSKQVREMGVSSHFLGQSERVAHFGLGQLEGETVHEVRVTWPRTRIVSVFADVPKNEVFTITAPEEEIVEPVPPPTVVSLSAPVGGPADGEAVNFLLTFSRPVQGVTLDAFDVNLVSGTAQPGHLTALEGAGASYVLTLDRYLGQGELRVDLSDITGISDLEGIALLEGIQGGTLTIDAPFHTADTTANGKIDLSEVTRVVQFFNAGAFCCASQSAPTEDGFQPGAGDELCEPHAADYSSQDWKISLGELLRIIQLFNVDGYSACTTGEGGFCAEAR